VPPAATDIDVAGDWQGTAVVCTPVAPTRQNVVGVVNVQVVVPDAGTLQVGFVVTTVPVGGICARPPGVPPERKATAIISAPMRLKRA
jgi:hypothetical protein